MCGNKEEPQSDPPLHSASGCFAAKTFPSLVRRKDKGMQLCTITTHFHPYILECCHFVNVDISSDVHTSGHTND